MAWEESSRICLHMQLIAILSRIGVNVDIPSHSVVFGNPCVIKRRDWATEGYVNNIVE